MDLAQELAGQLGRGDAGDPAPYHVVREWALVLTARRILNRTERVGWGRSWRLLVPASLAEAARREILSYSAENSAQHEAQPEPHYIYHNTTATLVVLLGLAWFHLASNPATGMNPAMHISELGRASSEFIHQGQWWRLATALTLHGDTLHLLANLGFGGVIFVFLNRELGSGLGWFLTLVAGICGNLLNYQFQNLGHVSLGASTAVFGAVGAMSGVQAARQWLGRVGGATRVRGSGTEELRRALLPLAAGLLLLGWLGSSGDNTDLGAHFWGFISGVVLGLGAGALLARLGRPSKFLQRLLALASLAVIGGAWAWAFSS